MLRLAIVSVVCLVAQPLTLSTVAGASGTALPVIFNDPLYQAAANATDFTTADLARAAADIAPGAVLRFEVDWYNIQQCFGATGAVVTKRASCVTPGPYNFNDNNLTTNLDSIASYLQTGQVKLLPMVMKAPTWAWGYQDLPATQAKPNYDPNHPVMPPGGDPVALGWWQNFVGALVSYLEGRYGSSSLAGIEVWNEEDNYPASWSLSPGNPQTDAVRYSQVLCSAYAGAHQADTGLPVVFGGFQPDDSSYLDDAYASPAADIRQCMTAIGLHPYNSYNGSPWLAPNTPGSEFLTGPSTVESVAGNHGDANRAIWITEFGYPITNPPTAQQQADWDSQAYQLAGSLSNVQAMGIHTLFDQAGGFEICAGPRSPLSSASELKQTISGIPTATASC